MRCEGCGRANRDGRLYCAGCGGRLGHFLGREREIEALEGALEDALAGRGRVVLLSGEPGIGKTRTAEELARRARAAGALVLWSRCPASEVRPAYGPWLQVLRGLLAARGDAALARPARNAEALAQLLPELGERAAGASVGALDRAEARVLLFDAIGATLRSAAATDDLVVVFDDLHWADATSLQLLQVVASELASSRVLLLGTFREGELDDNSAVPEALASLARSPGSALVTLAGLGEPDVARLLALLADERRRRSSRPRCAATPTETHSSSASSCRSSSPAAGWGPRTPSGSAYRRRCATPSAAASRASPRVAEACWT